MGTVLDHDDQERSVDAHSLRTRVAVLSWLPRALIREVATWIESAMWAVVDVIVEL